VMRLFAKVDWQVGRRNFMRAAVAQIDLVDSEQHSRVGLVLTG
jgi:hypothetical protein